MTALPNAILASARLAHAEPCPACEAKASAPCFDAGPGRIRRRRAFPHLERVQAALPSELLGTPISWKLARPELGGGVVGTGHAWWGIVLTIRPTGAPSERGPWVVRVRQAYAVEIAGYGETPAEAAADVLRRLGQAAAVYQSLRAVELARSPADCEDCGESHPRGMDEPCSLMRDAGGGHG